MEGNNVSVISLRNNRVLREILKIMSQLSGRSISTAGTRRDAQTRARLLELHFLFVLASRISFKIVPLFPAAPRVKHLNPRDAETRQHRVQGRRRSVEGGREDSKDKDCNIF